MLNNRLCELAELYDSYFDAQHGFINKSTTDCIFILHQLIDDYTARSKRLYVIFVDFS